MRLDKALLQTASSVGKDAPRDGRAAGDELRGAIGRLQPPSFLDETSLSRAPVFTAEGRRSRQDDEERAGMIGDEVMTHDPETLRPDDRICYAVNRMIAMGCRTVPVVDAERRPVGIVSVEDIATWLAALFPEAILNLRPGDHLKRPAERDGG